MSCLSSSLVIFRSAAPGGQGATTLIVDLLNELHENDGAIPNPSNNHMTRFTDWMLAWLVAACCGIWLHAGQAPRPLPDFSKTRDEATQLLQGLIRIDTSNPPGNETKAVDYIKSLLDQEGIPSQIYGLRPGRDSIVARLKGNGRKRPIAPIAMVHTPKGTAEK